MLNIIAAVDEAGVIGHQGALPWHLPSDLAYFKRLTKDRVVAMGRLTWEALGCKPLPNRSNLVISTQRDLHVPRSVVLLESPSALLVWRHLVPEVFVIGGAALYAWALPHADRLYLTRVRGTHVGDTHFPTWDPAAWTLLSREEREPTHCYEVYEHPRAHETQRLLADHAAWLKLLALPADDAEYDTADVLRVLLLLLLDKQVLTPHDLGHLHDPRLHLALEPPFTP